MFRSFFRRWAVLLALALVPSVAVAGADPAAKMQLLFLGADPAADALGVLPADYPVISLNVLPTVDAAQQTIFAARLRASPVSTFVTQPGGDKTPSLQFYLVGNMELQSTADGYSIAVGGEPFGLPEFADRVNAVIAAFAPKDRRIGFLRITDPEDVFPAAIEQVRAALNGFGFDMLVVMIGAGQPVADCAKATGPALHYALLSGLADRAPFGDGNGVSSSAEAEAFLTAALKRRTARDPACGPKYSLLIKSTDDPDRPLVTHSDRPVFAGMETTLNNETFEAVFLMESDDQQAVQDYLASCQYCPNEAALTERLRAMEEVARTRALEAEIWQRIGADTNADRLSIYLKNCTLCVYKAEAKARILEVDAQARALDGEQKQFVAAMQALDLDALRAYAADCIACAYSEQADKKIAELEADAEYMVEYASLAAALSSRQIDTMQAYLDNCQLCRAREQVQATLATEIRHQSLSQPCLSLAAVPQLGGPRQLEAIDQAAARQACEAAVQAFPEDGVLRTTLGRIAQAAGDFEAARAAYDFGMQHDVPSAFGLAAYSNYAPPQGGEIDLEATDALARKGAELDDWLSQEILTVLYSKDLVPGKTPEDAFRIAEHIANEGNALAQFFVGYYYLTGTGVEISEEKAAEWLSKSAGQGYIHAYSFLAELYEKGAGTDPNPEQAADLYWTALKLGDPTATDRLTAQLKNRSRDVIRIIQKKLRDQGDYRGSVDGIAGRGTVAAIRRVAEAATEQG